MVSGTSDDWPSNGCIAIKMRFKAQKQVCIMAIDSTAFGLPPKTFFSIAQHMHGSIENSELTANSYD